MEQERRIKLGSSITRFAIGADGSDEDKAKLKQGKWLLKKVAEEEPAHIDKMLENKSGVNQLKLKLGRKSRHHADC